MNVTCNASSTEKRSAIIRDLTAMGHEATRGAERLAYRNTVRVWRVKESDKKAVTDAMLAVDPAAEKVWTPAYVQG